MPRSEQNVPEEINFDGIVGPTHNYAGLSPGNLASTENQGHRSNPRAAARQGLAKMRALVHLGVPQGVLPPQHRPDVRTLRLLGFDADTDADVLRQVARTDRALLHAVSSASSMWTANAATVTPSSDAVDGRVHLTVANLVSNFHRSLEATQTEATLRRLFGGPRFVVHPPLPRSPLHADEGAANHTRLVRADGSGVHVFVYGRAGYPESSATHRFPARQTRAACEAIARRHRIPASDRVFLRQRPEAIDGGVFHNDVISVGHRDLFLAHEWAFAEADAARALQARVGQELKLDVVSRESLSLEDAVRSYLFNSQIVSRSDGSRCLIAPIEAQESAPAEAVIQRWKDELGLIQEVRFFDLRQSMRNGGGPACLRLRIPLNVGEQTALTGRGLVDEALLDELERWVDAHYRDRLAPNDLEDPSLLDESRKALDELTTILELGSIYPFQSASEHSN